MANPSERGGRPRRSRPSDGGPLAGGGSRSRTALSLLALAAAGTLSLFLGSVPLPPADVLSILLHTLTGGALAPDPCPVPLVTSGHLVDCATVQLLFWDFRAPEVVLALVVGGGLAMAGCTMQGVFRNPLGDPFLLGISSGASVGAAAVIVVGFGAAEAVLLLPLLAFLGGLGTTGVVLLAARSPRARPETLILTGVALSSLFGSVLMILFTLHPFAAEGLLFWTMGSFAQAVPTTAGLTFAGVVGGSALLALHGRDLNLLQMGEETAKGLGADVAALRRRLLLLASFVTAVTVAFAGVIGFVGLVSPHIMRRLHGPDYRSLLPMSAIFGALFTVLADDLADGLLGSGGLLPVGVITSFVGAPFFLWVLYRRGRQGGTVP